MYIITRSVLRSSGGLMFEDIDEATDFIIEDLTDDLFDEVLDDAYAPIEICGAEYLASRILKEIDPTKYQCDKCDYYDSLRDKIKEQLEGLPEEQPTMVPYCNMTVGKLLVEKITE